ncbi:hypothetical protein [Chryseobacterium sp. Tr-659]|nr:hypothetical protein [Chryseobacterium sp. Tr-659]
MISKEDTTRLQKLTVFIGTGDPALAHRSLILELYVNTPNDFVKW